MAAQEGQGPIRVWADGCFDLTHWGHLRVFKQAKECGDISVIGIHSDEDIARHKGPPLMDEEDRYFCARSCRWVDEVVEAAPYVTYLETLYKYNCNFCVHGADITTDENGVDTYHKVKTANMYREIERTDGVSTSEIINRMLCIANPNFTYEKKVLSLHQLPTYTDLELNLPEDLAKRMPTADDTVIFIDGSFDLLHSGTLKALQAAKELGTYLIVGVHVDEIVHEAHGRGFPILSLYERVFSVLACRWVDAAIPASPWTVSEEFLSKFNISKVALGKSHSVHVNRDDPYLQVKTLDKLLYINSQSGGTTVQSLCEKVSEKSALYTQRNLNKGEITEEQAIEITSTN